MKIAIYPGSFDPITNGHIDVLKRALQVFDKIIVLVAVNPDKKSRFTYQERVAMIREATANLGNVEVDYTQGLTVRYAKEHGAKHLIRGLRSTMDFEYEFQLAAANELADGEIDNVYFLGHGATENLTSSMIMELHNSGVDVSNLVPRSVVKRLIKK